MKNIIVSDRLKKGEDYMREKQLSRNDWSVVTIPRHLDGMYVDEMIVLAESLEMSRFLGKLKLTLKEYVDRYCKMPMFII